MIIAVDGPAGAGKGTLAKTLAGHFKMAYLDTGALYRAVGAAVLKQNKDPQDPDAATAAAQHLDFDFRDIGGGIFHAFIDGEDAEQELRTAGVGEAASMVSSVPAVRQALKEFQVNFAQKHTDGHQEIRGAILDGRDIGTIICPDADLKFFLEADARVRAERRLKQLRDKGEDISLEEVYAQTVARDKRDRTRKDAPLKPADDAIIVDTSRMQAEQVFEHIKALVQDNLPPKSAFQSA